MEKIQAEGRTNKMTPKEQKQAIAEYIAVPTLEKKLRIGEIAERYHVSKPELVDLLYKNGAMSKKQVAAYARYNPEYVAILNATPPSPEAKSSGKNGDGCYVCDEACDDASLEPFFENEHAEECNEAEDIYKCMPASVKKFIDSEIVRLTNEICKIKEEIRNELKKNEKLILMAKRRNEIVEERMMLNRFAQRCALVFKGDYDVEREE